MPATKPRSEDIPPAPPPTTSPTTAAKRISRTLSSAATMISAGWRRRGAETSELIGSARQLRDAVADRLGLAGAQRGDVVRPGSGVNDHRAQAEQVPDHVPRGVH